ncbi:MAG: pilin [Firmicutes bacterium]|nr:pilin [Bacillota bacterium]
MQSLLLNPFANVVRDINNITNIAVTIFLATIASFVSLYAIYVGFRLASAKDDAARINAKMQLMYSLVGAVSIGAIAAVVRLAFTGVGGAFSTAPPGADRHFPGATVLVQTIGHAINAILSILSTAAIVFAVFVGWQLMKAEDEAKRKEAKKQLLYTAIGVIAAITVATVMPTALSQAGRPR